MEDLKQTDHDILGEKATVTHDEAVHFGKLTEDELLIEKKLRLKIDILIMPLVILVYLMNYIDRYARLNHLDGQPLTHTPQE